MVTFTTKDGKRVSFKTNSERKKSSSRKKTKSIMSHPKRAALSRSAKKRPRYKTGPKKGQFKKVRK